ncbi:hypothetical protein PACF725_1672 [Pseudomonas aeruginosa]|nr:hypothetical protein PACF725_1672 [Pseudomonas aeruginosa]
MPRHREVPLRHLLWSLHARKIRVEKINLSPLCSPTPAHSTGLSARTIEFVRHQESGSLF